MKSTISIEEYFTDLILQKLYDPSRWSDLHASFRATLFAVHSIPDQPFLHLSLSVGLAALKLPACYSVTPTPESITHDESSLKASNTEDIEMRSSSLPINRHHHTTSSSTSQNYDPSLLSNLNSPKPLPTIGSSPNSDCPVCDSNGLGVLAKECPWSHHLNSIIVCGLTGRVVEDGDRLAVLPNGRVYSRDGLEKLAERDEGRIRCPKTGQVFGMDEIRRVFIS